MKKFSEWFIEAEDLKNKLNIDALKKKEADITKQMKLLQDGRGQITPGFNANSYKTLLASLKDIREKLNSA